MSQSDDEELFNPADFESIELKFGIKNLSTGKSFSKEKKIALIEVGDQALTLSLPMKSCQNGQHLIVDVFNWEKPLFTATAKASEVIEVSIGTISVKLELLQFETKRWEDFLNVFSKRQEEISLFFERGKK